ncbi:MAG: hypothetical protein NT007_08905 [Candidatus Kapabacteria bacterium]|nr:hypothetical protein [Candidatus Kapabacteria bacterium]
MKKISIIVFLAFLPLILFAEPGGSNYSMFGIGDIIRSNTASYDGIAGTSIAFPTQTCLSSVNPALWSLAGKTRLQVGYSFTQHANQGDNTTTYQFHSKPNSIMAIFSVDTSLGLAISLGIYPYSTINYFVQSSEKYKIDDLSGTANTTFYGTGGLTAAYAGTSINLFKGLSLGFAAQLLFGQGLFDYETYISNGDQSRNYVIDSYRSFGLRTGLVYRGIDNLYLGAYYEHNFSLLTNRSSSLYSYWALDTSYMYSFSNSMPGSLGIGASYMINNLQIGADFKYTDFSNFAYNLSTGSNATFVPGINTSFGISKNGNTKPGSEYIDQMSFRAGFSHSNLFYQVFGKKVNDDAISIGSTFPLRGTALIDAAMTFGRRGENSNNLVLDYYYQFSMSISIGENWFKPFKRY